MPRKPEPPMSDAALDALAREWFAEARARDRAEKPVSRSRGDAGADGGDGILDWLFGAGDDDADGGDDGD